MHYVFASRMTITEKDIIDK